MRLRPPDPLCLLLLLVACGGARSPFTRVTADDGRVYYTRMEISFMSASGAMVVGAIRSSITPPRASKRR